MLIIIALHYTWIFVIKIIKTRQFSSRMITNMSLMTNTESLVYHVVYIAFIVPFVQKTLYTKTMSFNPMAVMI